MSSTRDPESIESESIKKCKETLKFLDYLRKSQCTLISPLGNPVSQHPLRCTNTLTEMENAAKKCLALSLALNTKR